MIKNKAWILSVSNSKGEKRQYIIMMYLRARAVSDFGALQSQ